jgi:hypothetical protein
MIQAPEAVIPNPTFRTGALVAAALLMSSCDSSDHLAAPPTPNVHIDSVEIDSSGGVPSDSVPVMPPIDSIAGPPTDSVSRTPADTCAAMAEASRAASQTGSGAPGIAFGAFDMPPSMMGSKFTGIVRASGPHDILCTLATARRAGARIMVRLSGGDRFFREPDRTLNMAKWKARIDRYKRVNFQSFIDDGTLIGHYILDEPHNANTWKNQVPFETVEAMARYSKELWPNLTTVVRAYPDWLSNASFRWQYLDAAWAQYSGSKGEVKQWMNDQSTYARREGFGLIVGLNVLNGGNGSSGIKGTRTGLYTMSAKEVREWGSVLVADTHACAFYAWKYTTSYFARTDIQSALDELASKSKNRERQSCKR